MPITVFRTSSLTLTDVHENGLLLDSSSDEETESHVEQVT